MKFLKNINYSPLVLDPPSSSEMVDKRIKDSESTKEARNFVSKYSTKDQLKSLLTDFTRIASNFLRNFRESPMSTQNIQNRYDNELLDKNIQIEDKIDLLFEERSHVKRELLPKQLDSIKKEIVRDLFEPLEKRMRIEYEGESIPNESRQDYKELKELKNTLEEIVANKGKGRS